MDRIQKAVDLFESGQSCSNAVFAAYSDLLGVEETTACQIASGFGGGIGGREELCGADSGMVLCGGIGYPVGRGSAGCWTPLKPGLAPLPAGN